MTMLQHGLVPSTGGYQIERSLRFNSADSAYLNRTPASAGNRRTWTWSAWVKRSAIGGTNPTLFSVQVDANNQDAIRFDTGNELRVFSYQSSAFVYSYKTSAVYRDPSAWYHIVVAIDTTNATSADRGIIYVNGQRITNLSLNTAPTQNADGLINTTNSHQIGRNATSEYFDGYITDVYFIDGSAKTPSDFGETDTDTGVWKPKAYSGSYGTNGFYLKFADNSGTTSTTLGKDSSGNGNNWTPNNFSVTAGAGNDSLVDTPTPYGTDTGAGGEVRGNYCTLSPTYALNVTYNTPTNGNLEVALSNNSTAYGTFSFTTGKWYWEVTVSGAGSAGFGYIGVMDSTFIKTDNTWSSQARTYIDTGSKYGGSSSSYGASWTNGDVIGVAVDMDAGTIVFYKNGSSQGTAFSDLAGKEWKPLVYATTATYSMNFGQRPFAYTAPSGFKALCTQNLPTPTIGATATTRADDYFNTVLYTGDGANPRTITGVGFQPDLVWVKRRDGVSNNFLQDAVRGVTSTDSRSLVSNATDAETNYYTVNGGVTAFTSDGFTTSGGTTNNNLNNSGNTMVAWNWKANGAGSSNTQGTITSTVSANTTAGFSIVTWTGNSANATIGHGLGVAPSMYIIKYRGTTDNWYVYHTSAGTNKYLVLNATDAAATSTTIWQNTAPTSTVFSIGSGNNNSTIVAYCFAPVAGYSAFGSYTGNGSTDGPFIYTGFRPAFVLMKVTSTTDSWVIVDRTRSPYNVAKLTLFPNLSNAENDGAIEVDMLSNGFKLRTANSNVNASQTFIYAAFAEVPTKFSLAR